MARSVLTSAKTRWLAGAVIVLLSATGIHYTQSNASAPAAPAEAPPVPVVVRTLVPEQVRVWTAFSGRLTAVDQAEIRPEVSGRITEIRFTDGQKVNAGDILLVIDPRPYEAAVAKAEADLASAQTNAQFAKLEEKRAADMLKTKAIAQRLYDERANARRVADATLLAADAQLKQARIDLEHAFVKAPIAGQVSRAEITEGNVVQAGPGAPLLTSIVSNAEIYADFEVDEQTYVRNMRAQSNGAQAPVSVKLSLKGDGDAAYEGTIESFDNKIDPASGTIRARARFTNTDGALVPGMFVAVSMANAAESTALTVPDKALGFDQSKKFVYVVGADNKVSYREVQLGDQIEANRVVLSGLNEGDKIIVDGLQHVRPGASVAPKEEAAELASASASSDPVLTEEGDAAAPTPADASPTAELQPAELQPAELQPAELQPAEPIVATDEAASPASETPAQSSAETTPQE